MITRIVEDFKDRLCECDCDVDVEEEFRKSLGEHLRAQFSGIMLPAPFGAGFRNSERLVEMAEEADTGWYREQLSLFQDEKFRSGEWFAFDQTCGEVYRKPTGTDRRRVEEGLFYDLALWLRDAGPQREEVLSIFRDLAEKSGVTIAETLLDDESA